jgi:hypothetical protein
VALRFILLRFIFASSLSLVYDDPYFYAALLFGNPLLEMI